MATRSLQPLEDLIEARDALQASYNEISKTAITQYSMQDRQVIYEQRRQLRSEIDAMNRKIGLADPNVNATGMNKADFFNWNLGKSR
tara:strand:- start:128 stop:388 length:261 start_codon:yes stop_codon:yes gene_type:complete